MLITHMQDMQEVTQELHYENYRSEKLARGRQAGGGGGAARSLPQTPAPPTPAAAAPASGGASKDNLLMQKEEEIRRMREMMERLQAELEKEKHTPPNDAAPAPPVVQ